MFNFPWLKPMSPAELHRLESHIYRSSGQSLFEPLCQIYWSWLFEYVPPWIAPNVLTVFGLLINLTCTVVLVYFCPTATEEAPPWALIMSAVGLLMYQCLDSFDGKQCRKLDQDSPLEEFYDHGCDAVSTVCVSVGACIACGIGLHPNWMFLCSFIAMFLYFCSHWQAYVSGTVRFGLIDVVEAHFAVVVIYLVSAFGGMRLWHSTLPVLGVDPYVFPVIGIIGGAIYSCYNYYQGILKEVEKSSTVADTSVLSPGLHVGLVLTLAFIIFKKSSSRLFENYSCLYLLTFGMVMAKLSNKLVIVHMTKSKFPLADSSLIVPGLLLLNQSFGNFIHEHKVLWIALVFSSLDLACYFIGASLQISSHLRVPIFTVKHRN
ncbi:cholinephosphotransferase 1-like [Brachionichthys hirsutus]|uniref:cholinephosphotransferase 1-like n=1 Tax=Brachionichthys hirsutus TaxID=412623 RepID=UPI0036045EAF